VVYWQQFEASEWDIEYDAAKLASHGISDWEAEPLLLIVQVVGERKMRVLNGWPL